MPGTAHVALFISSILIAVNLVGCGQAQPPDEEARETIEAALTKPRPENPQEDIPPAPSVSATPPTIETPDLQATIAAAVEVTLTALPTPTPTPTPTSTYTPRPQLTNPPLPTPTREYLGEEELAEIVPGVTLWLRASYGAPNYIGCFAPDPGFNLILNISNKSNRQFNLRFEKNTFHVTDNIGREYSVQGAGVNECPSEPGLSSTLYLQAA